MRLSYFDFRGVFYLITGILITNYFDVTAQPCSLPQPAGVQITGVTDCDAALSWNAVPGASYYGVKFKPKGNNTWSPIVNVGLNTNYTFTNLNASTPYKFAVAAFCSNNKTSGFKSLAATTVDCAPPVVTQVQLMPPDAVNIEWDGNGCPSAFNQIRYKKMAASNWTFILTGSSTSIMLQNLSPAASYIFQVTDCADTTGSWSIPGTFEILSRPNILMIVLDDARYDSYSCNGAPSFFQSPNIDQIASEGVNFKTSFCVESLCIPSRGTIVTGLYPHKHGATNNSENIHPDLPTTAKILDSAGYYTAWIGKYHLAVKPQDGYDYWLGTKVNSGTDEYNNLKYNYNGTLKTINGHDTDIITDSTLAFIDRNADKSFFATIGFHAPHNPYIPQGNYNGIYEGEQMPVPPNTAKYQSNFPSFLYKLPPSYYITPPEIAGEYQPYFEMMAGLDAAIGEIIQKLTDLSLIDNTLLIFTSDNGLMFGEHGLFLKHFAYDPSMRVPLFIRYPPWFEEGTVITNQMALNVDIAPTILDAAGISNNYSFDGISLRALANGSATRTSMYFESVYDPYTEELPSIRCVRTMHAKLIQYGCNHVTEEFFDLATDPSENTNQVKNTDYFSAIQDLGNQLDLFSIQLNDTAQETILNCFLKPGVQRNSNTIIDNQENLPVLEDDFHVYPVPANDQVTITFLSMDEATSTPVFIMDGSGRIQWQETLKVVKGENIRTLNLEGLNSGYYFITIKVNGTTVRKPITIIND